MRLSLQQFGHRVEFDLDPEMANRLARLDKGAPDVVAAHQRHLERQPGLLGIAERGGDCPNRAPARRCRPRQGIRARAPAPAACAPSKHCARTAGCRAARNRHTRRCSACRRRRERIQRSHALFVDHEDLAGLDLAHVLGADQIERAGLRRDDRRAVEIAEDQRTKALRIAHRDQRVLGQHHQRVRAAHLRERLDHALGQIGRMRAGDQMDDEFAVRGGLKNRAAGLEPLAQFLEIHQVAVVRERESAAAHTRPPAAGNS